ncbi:GGDEF domain-containing protein [Pluralibacter gergoviae]|nr:GGDEF domain-containing protein [Pluralibacter gergoviae]
MKNVQDGVRKRQALLFSAAITLICLTLWVFFLHQNRLSQVSNGMSEMITRMIIVFNDNELIADATGVRFEQLRNGNRCGEMSDFRRLDNGSWAINGDKAELNPALGTLISRSASTDGRCMYAAAEFIRHKINELNPGEFNVHRYIIARDAEWLYWFAPEDSTLFSFSDSSMAKDPAAFFTPPVSFYDRVLQKNVRIKASSATDFYSDKITGGRAYSIVSYIYDLSGEDVSSHIVGYLLYDHSQKELRRELTNAFAGALPPGLMVSLYNLSTRESVCLTESCSWLRPEVTRQISSRYAFRYALPLYLLAIRDPAASVAIVLSPLLFLLIAFFLRKRLNLHDIKTYTDPLTGCFTRKIMEFIRNRQDEYSVVILMDCNKFKSINDTWGHGVGDRALQIIARQMMLNVRSEKDLVIRTGGDEFVILLNQTPLAEAKSIAARVAERIVDSDFTAGGAKIPLSVSWGVSLFQGDLDETIQLADADMYRMKHELHEGDEGRRSASAKKSPAGEDGAKTH